MLGCFSSQCALITRIAFGLPNFAGIFFKKAVNSLWLGSSKSGRGPAPWGRYKIGNIVFS